MCFHYISIWHKIITVNKFFTGVGQFASCEGACVGVCGVFGVFLYN